MANRSHSARATAGGFTLLEVMIALAILAVSLVAIAGINANAIDMHSYAKRLTLATLLARSKMADLETKLMSEDLPADDSAEEGNFEEEGFPEYQWQAEIVRPKTENVTPAQILGLAGLDSADPSKGGSSPKAGSGANPISMAGLAGGGGQGQLMAAAATGGAGLLGGAMNSQVQTMLDLLGKSVREIRLTVSWQTGKQVDKFTVVTHVVSFGKDTAQLNSDPASQAALQGAATNAAGQVTGGVPGLPPALINNPALQGLPRSNIGNIPGLGTPRFPGNLGIPRIPGPGGLPR